MYLEYQLLNGKNVKAYNDYHEANNEAMKQKLSLAEYGDVYGTKTSYAFWNKTGDRNEDEMIITYYAFNENGKPTQISEQELKRILFY